MSQKSICSAIGIEIGRGQPEQVLEWDFWANHCTKLVRMRRLVVDSRMAKPISRSSELLGDRRVHGWIVAMILAQIMAGQLRQEFRIGDVGNLGADNHAGILIQLLGGPIRMLHG